MPSILSAESLPHIQGNILTPFKKDRFLYLFARFGGAQDARNWLKTIVADPNLASAQKMLDEPTRPVWLGISFTSSGLKKLDSTGRKSFQDFTAFQQGAAGGSAVPAAVVGDPAASDPSKWVVGNPNQSPVDVVLTIAANTDAFAAAAEKERKRAAAFGLDVLQLDQGDGTEDGGQPAGRLDGKVDHFGFRDGISQPGIRGFSEEVIRNRRLEDAHQLGSPIIASGEFVLGYDAEPRFYALPGTSRPTPPDWMHDGSFQVLLRLTQDVRRWRSRVASLRSVGSSSDVVEGAIGRTRTGHSLTLAGQGDNDFTYASDPNGEHTPLHAHIRKMNPRDDDVFHDRQHRLLRRGTSFGPFVPEGEPVDGADRGMMFNAFMASIEEQFEYVQRHWANPFTPSETSAALATPDALIGAGRTIRVRLRDGRAVDLPFEPLVRTSGAVYAFAPSIEALGELSRP